MEEDEGQNPPKILLDTRMTLSDEIIKEKIHTAWPWDRFYLRWNFMKQYMDGEASKPIAKYFCQRKSIISSGTTRSNLILIL